MTPERDYSKNPEAGPEAPARYIAAGLRVVPISPHSKAATRSGFGAANPEFCTPPDRWRSDELTAILLGPCPLGDFAGGRLLCGLDLDPPFSYPDLEARLGALPPTLSSKNSRHLYFWLPAGADLRQCNDVFRTKAAGHGAVDLRPAAGGYFLERGDWDSADFTGRGPEHFDHTRIADLPSAVLEALGPRKRGRPPAPCAVQPGAYEGEASPFGALDEGAVDALARSLAAVWPRPGQGGGHDLALAFGGIMADAHASLDEVLGLADRIFHYAGAPGALNEVATSLENRRAARTNKGVYGWPMFSRILLEANNQDNYGRVRVLRTLQLFRAQVPGLMPPPVARAPRQSKTAPPNIEGAVHQTTNRKVTEPMSSNPNQKAEPNVR